MRAGGLMPLIRACLLIWVSVGELSGSGQTTLKAGVSISFIDSTETFSFDRTSNIDRVSGTETVSASTYGTMATRLCLLGEKNF